MSVEAEYEGRWVSAMLERKGEKRKYVTYGLVYHWDAALRTRTGVGEVEI